MRIPAWLLVALLSQDALGQESEHPNILLFLVDDLGWQDLSVPLHTETTPFNERYRTPNVERLAREGMRFTNAYASSPVCTPTRTSIMTGMSPARSHITFWTLDKNKDTSIKHPTLSAPEWDVNGLQEEDVALPRLLQEAGYRTIHVGKAHFGSNRTSGADPTNLGFDVNIAGHAAGAPASFYGTDHFAVTRKDKPPGSVKSVWNVPGLEKYHGQDIYLTEALAIEAAAEIERAIQDGVPFFMNFAPYAVHAPIQPNKRLLEHYPDLDPREAAYATMVETYDNALGTLLDTLKQSGALDETIVIFHSDNGGLSAHSRGPAPDGSPLHTHNAPLRSGKGSAYEGGTRVPLIIRWPGTVTPDSASDAAMISHDLFPTILSMASVPVPEAHVAHVDGQDLSDVLIGETPDERTLVWHMPHYWGVEGPGVEPFSAARRGPWKIVYYHDGGRVELYNLDEDVGETKDLAAVEAERVERMRNLLDAELTRRGSQMSIDSESGEPVPGPAATESDR